MLSIGNQWDSVLREDLQSESFAHLIDVSNIGL